MVQTPEYRHQNALLWIRHVAGLHYFGAAFDPEHMRDIANIAADALCCTRDLPDYHDYMAAAMVRGREMAAELSRHLVEPESAAFGTKRED